MDALKNIYEAVSIIDLIYLIITIISLIQCYKKGFILSILSMAKWLLAYVVTLILFPRIKPYFEDIIDSEYVLDVTLGVVIFILVIFIILIANRAIGKTIKFVGLGRLDSIFGFFLSIADVKLPVPGPTSKIFLFSIFTIFEIFINLFAPAR